MDLNSNNEGDMMIVQWYVNTQFGQRQVLANKAKFIKWTLSDIYEMKN